MINDITACLLLVKKCFMSILLLLCDRHPALKYKGNVMVHLNNGIM